MTGSRSFAVLLWRLVGVVFIYAMITLAVATAAAPPAAPNAFLGGFHRALTPLAQLLPGAGLWPRVMDMRGTLTGDFPTPVAAILLLMAAGAAALYRADRIRAQARKDAETEHDETLRERKRQELRRR